MTQDRKTDALNYIAFDALATIRREGLPIGRDLRAEIDQAAFIPPCKRCRNESVFDRLSAAMAEETDGAFYPILTPGRGPLKVSDCGLNFTAIDRDLAACMRQYADAIKAHFGPNSQVTRLVYTFLPLFQPEN